MNLTRSCTKQHHRQRFRRTQATVHRIRSTPPALFNHSFKLWMTKEPVLLRGSRQNPDPETRDLPRYRLGHAVIVVISQNVNRSMPNSRVFADYNQELQNSNCNPDTPQPTPLNYCNNVGNIVLICNQMLLH